MGIKAYNAECRAIVMKYASEWEQTVTRIGRWIDFKNDYKTLNTSFMESVWWVFKQLYDKGQIYKGFQIRDEETGNIWILLPQRLEMLYKDPKTAKYVVLEEFLGSSLKGMEYEPLYSYFLERRQNGAFTVMTDTYVTDDSGTGIVHCAPAFGEDDYRVCKDHGIVTGEDVPCPIDAVGKFTSEVSDYTGQYIKDADKVIQKDLKQRGRLIRQTQFLHSYPFCWRSDTPLIYRAVPSWFVRVSNITDRLLANNAKTLWVPDFVKEKRFANWLENARDWNISRNRYWGTPIPLWISDDGQELVCVGSVAELEDLSGVKGIVDLHRDSIDHITIPSKMGKGVLKRTTEVLDCWFESGSMPYAQQHYPFENAEKFRSVFPADFIAEGLDQTRGWFYTLLVLSTHLQDCAPWKNLIVNGLVLAKDGKKMSKSKKNYPDPNNVLEEFGADVLRLYLLNSPCVRAEPLRFDEKGLKNLTASVFLPWYNAYRFFFAQVALIRKEHNHVFQYQPSSRLEYTNVMDQWILASTQSLIKFVKEEMAAYRLYTVVPRLLLLIDDLTNWYIRFNRKRLKGENGVQDADKALSALFEVLFTLCKMMAPYTPFIVETMYQNLKTCLVGVEEEDSRSIHFLMFPEVKSEYFNENVERAIGRMRTVIEGGRNIREKKNLSLKTPLREVIVINSDSVFASDIDGLKSYIEEELNVKTVTVTGDENKYGVRYELKPDHKVLGTRLGKESAKIRKALSALSYDQVLEYVEKSRLMLEGIQLVENDLEVVRVFDSKKNDTKYEATNQNGVLVILDTFVDESLILEKYAREIVNRAQRLRKKAGLLPTDDVDYFFAITADAGGVLQKSIDSQKAQLVKTLKGRFESIDLDSSDTKIVEEEQEVDDSKFILRLVKA
ncbi:isoleucine--tRNA ligase [Phlyctochytrium bullatum]|nr:isoleucine--tRNA ligase [Phlyctochytrium bullatum]